MARPRGEPTKVVRLPADVIEELRRRAERKGLSVGAYLRAALGDPVGR